MTLRPNQNIINKIYKNVFLTWNIEKYFSKRTGYWSRSEEWLEQVRGLVGAGQRISWKRSEVQVQVRRSFGAVQRIGRSGSEDWAVGSVGRIC